MTNLGAIIEAHPPPILRTFGGLMAVHVPAGISQVEFKYRAWDVYIGYAISGLLIIGAALSWLRKRFLIRATPVSV